jgi:HlyD family secretion protein
MNTALKIVVFLVLVGVVALVGKSMLKKDQPQTVAPKFHTVKRLDIEQSVYGSGTVRCANRAEVATQVAGKIREFRVEEGQAVNPSQVLCIMANEEIENKLEGAKSQLSLAQRTHAQAAKKYEDEKQNRLLYEQPSKEELERLSIEAERAKVALDQATESVNSLEKDVKALTLSVPAELKGTVLKSFIKSSEIRLDPDKVYPAATPLFVLGDLSSLIVQGTILESDREKIKEGDPASVHLGRQGTFAAKVTNLSLIPSEGGRYDVRLDFDKPPSGANEGLTVDFRIVVQKKSNVLAVPVEYVEAEAGRHWVQRVEEESVTRVPVQVGISSDSFYEVTAGLKEGDVIRWRPGGKE